MNAQELKEKILEWESEIAESFVDYFAHDAVPKGLQETKQLPSNG